MSGKNRAFALAIATAALVGFCAPMASAATVQGPGSNTGFNGDSILNLSGNQLPINACNNQIPIQGAGVQVPIQSVTALLGLGNTGDTNTTSNTEACTNTPTENNTSNTNTAPTMGSNNGGNGGSWGNDHNCQCSGGSSDPSSSDPSNTGFNNDSILKVTGNQLPVNFCNNQIPVQLIGAQVPAEGLLAAVDALGTGNTNSATQAITCTNTPTENNTTNLNT